MIHRRGTAYFDKRQKVNSFRKIPLTVAQHEPTQTILLVAQQYQRINRQSALCWNPGS